MSNKTVRFYTLGCKVNQYETQSIRERFVSRGFKEIFNGRKADVYLINTCTVTHKADKDSRYYINKARSQNPKAKVILTGCIACKDKEALSGFKGVDYIISKKFFPDGISAFSGHTRAFLKIQDGCDNFCSYCIVPLVRGRSRSRSLKEIVCEAKRLVSNGFKEIVLTGICLGAYGKDLRPKADLTDVIPELEKIIGLLRIRLSSIEPNYVSDKLIKQILESKKLCRHLHIPLQSGYDEILKKMHRRYKSGDYMKLIKKIKKNIPDIAITTDVLVGFPGEKEENFKNTLKLIREINPLKLHIFPYSGREGTFATDNFKQAINPIVMKERILQIKSLSEKCAIIYKRQFLGKNMLIFIESCSKNKIGFYRGYTDNYIDVLIKSKQDLRNKLIPLTLKKICDGSILTYFS
mgnify:CR=1 FL=1